MRVWLSCALLPLLAAVPARAQQASGRWRLAWSSEVNGAAGAPPAASQWTYDRGNRRGWGNRELEYYCAPDDHAVPCTAQPNIYQDGHGHLVIEARRNAQGQWTSGRLKTLGLYQTAYGRIEARMRLPLGAGFWPAFWMLGSGAGGWPAAGEIDIMEHVPQLGPGTIQSTIHDTDFHGGNGQHGRFTLPHQRTIAGGFHNYGVIWAPGRVEFYVDDPRHPFATLRPLAADHSWPFDQPGTDPFYLLLNLAVGGNWPGPPDATTPPAAKMVIDYIRVYHDAQTGTPAF